MCSRHTRLPSAARCLAESGSILGVKVIVPLDTCQPELDSVSRRICGRGVYRIIEDRGSAIPFVDLQDLDPCG